MLMERYEPDTVYVDVVVYFAIAVLEIMERRVGVESMRVVE